jgi:hypothetical protein
MDVLREHLARSLRGGQAFVSFERALSGVKPELINARPNGALRSVYEELEHMRLAQQDLLYYAFEEGWAPRPWPEGFWPVPGFEASVEDWEEALNGFMGDLGKTVALVEDPGIDLLSVIPDSANEFTYLREITIIIEHNAYHLGKIVDSRKALGDWIR